MRDRLRRYTSADRRRTWRTRAGCAVTAIVVMATVGTVSWWTMLRMPTPERAEPQSAFGPVARQAAEQRVDQLPEPSPAVEAQAMAAARQRRLRNHVEQFADKIGQRNIRSYKGLVAARMYIEQQFTNLGYDVSRQTFSVQGRDCWNLEVILPGTEHPQEIVILGAHYDTARNTPGANDNASGMAALFELARAAAGQQFERTIRFVAFTNEEPPYFRRSSMGSVHYARRCRLRDENIAAVISLETMGYYDSTPGSQKYPSGVGAFFPDEGNFVGVVGNVSSRKLVRRIVATMRTRCQTPCEGAALPGEMQGVGWSDQWSFWQLLHRRFPFSSDRSNVRPP